MSKALRHPVTTYQHRRLKIEAVKKVGLLYEEMSEHPGGEYYFLAHGVLDPLSTFTARMVMLSDTDNVDNPALRGVIETVDQVRCVIAKVDPVDVVEYQLERAENFRLQLGDGLETDHMLLE
jgi:hypothetical protein